MTDLRTCIACGQNKPIEAFWRKTDGTQRTCKVCAQVLRNQRHKETRDRVARLRQERPSPKFVLVSPSARAAMTGPFVAGLVDVFNQIDKIKGSR